jgi:hypothetical protein
MRPLEALLVAALVLSLGLRWLQPRNRQVTATLLAMIGILAALHVIFDGARWEMIPAYAMAVAAAWILSRDLRRVSGAKRESRGKDLNRPARHIAVLQVSAAAAVVIPAWPSRIVLVGARWSLLGRPDRCHAH